MKALEGRPRMFDANLLPAAGKKSVERVRSQGGAESTAPRRKLERKRHGDTGRAAYA
jgi:hypothetical protein